MDDTTKSRSSDNPLKSPNSAAGAPEIEVTPEMIEAGVSAYRLRGTTIEEADNMEKRAIFSAIFFAMLSAYGLSVRQK